MWALAIYDKNKNKLFCSRDRMGIKPFYYTSYMGKFIFASELKSFMYLPKNIIPNFELSAIASLGKSTNDEETFLKDVKLLLSGSQINLDIGGNYEIKKWWKSF